MSYTSGDNQCVLEHGHDTDLIGHILPSEIGEHKCTGTLDCCFCRGYWLPEFKRCGARKILIETWLDKTINIEVKE